MPDATEERVNSFKRLCQYEIMATVPGELLGGLGIIKTEANTVWETTRDAGEEKPSLVAFAIWKLAVHALDCQNQPSDQRATLRAIRALIEIGHDLCEGQPAGDGLP
jgi:hypothetical protein